MVFSEGMSADFFLDISDIRNRIIEIEQSYEESLQYAKNLISETKKYNGDLCLLWHNTIFTEKDHKNLYSQLIQILQQQ